MASRRISGVFLLDQSSSAKMTEPTFSPESPAKLKPEMLMTDRTPGIRRNCGTSLFNSASVRPWVAPSGSWTSAKTAPWSSSGTKDEGVTFMIARDAPITRPNNPSVTSVRRAIHIAPFTYPRAAILSILLNHASGPCVFGRTFVSMWAHIAGLNVSATTSEKTTENDTVTANCR